MTDDQETCAIAEAKEQEAIFFCHVINIRDQTASVIKKDGTSFREGHPLFDGICGRFLVVPTEAQLGHRVLACGSLRRRLTFAVSGAQRRTRRWID
jgi:hypothetical protein